MASVDEFKGGEEAAFVDPFLLISTLLMIFLLILANMYFLAYFSHHADNSFGGSTWCKVVIVSNIKLLFLILYFSNLLIDSFLYHSRESNPPAISGCVQHQRGLQL